MNRFCVEDWHILLTLNSYQRLKAQLQNQLSPTAKAADVSIAASNPVTIATSTALPGNMGGQVLVGSTSPIMMVDSPGSEMNLSDSSDYSVDRWVTYCWNFSNNVFSVCCRVVKDLIIEYFSVCHKWAQYGIISDSGEWPTYSITFGSKWPTYGSFLSSCLQASDLPAG